MNEQEVEQLLFPKEAAAFLGVSIQELARLRREGRVKGQEFPMPGKKKRNLTLYKPSELRQADLTREKGRPRKKRIS